jgi:hypothetical protein
MFVLGIAIGAGIGYFAGQPTISNLQAQVYSLNAENAQLQNKSAGLTRENARIQSLQKTREAIIVTKWVVPSGLFDTQTHYKVRITNNNDFSIIVRQAMINVVDSNGGQLATNLFPQSISINQRSTVTLDLTTVLPPNTAGVGISVVFESPFGTITLG